METEIIEVLEVEGCTDRCSEDESIPESIQSGYESIQWFAASQARHKTRLEKTPFQRVMTELINTHQIDISHLRRGGARKTQYSQLAIDLINALKSRDMESFDSLKKGVVRQPVATLVVSSSEHVIALDRKVEKFSQESLATSTSLETQVHETLLKISQQRQAQLANSATLSNAEIAAAKNRGIARALQIFQAEQGSCDEVLAQLRVMNLEG